jgi:hypothetical protein
MVGEVEMRCSTFPAPIPIPVSVPGLETVVAVEGEDDDREGGEEARGAGKSSEGKSSPFHDLEEGKMRVEAWGVGVLGDEGGEVRGVRVWKWTCAADGVWAGDLRGDVGGVVYLVVVGGDVEGAARGVALVKTCSMSSNVLPTIVCSARSTWNVVDITSPCSYVVSVERNCNKARGPDLHTRTIKTLYANHSP